MITDELRRVTAEEFDAADIEIRNDPLWEQAYELHVQLVNKYGPIVSYRIKQRVPDGPPLVATLKIASQIQYEAEVL